MSMIPDCRTDENYNQKYLNEKDSDFLAGYDWAVKEIMNMFNNLEFYPKLLGILEGTNRDVAMCAVEDWAEAQRDELITSMIDGMDDAEYQSIKEAVDGKRQSTAENGTET